MGEIKDMAEFLGTRAATESQRKREREKRYQESADGLPRQIIGPKGLRIPSPHYGTAQGAIEDIDFIKWSLDEFQIESVHAWEIVDEILSTYFGADRPSGCR